MVAAYDVRNVRVTTLDGDGDLALDYPFRFDGLPPNEIGCGPGDDWSSRDPVRQERTRLVRREEIYRLRLSLAFAEPGASSVTILREEVPAGEQLYLGSPGNNAPGSIWWHEAVFAATDDGVWLGTGDDYEVEFVDWTRPRRPAASGGRARIWP